MLSAVLTELHVGLLSEAKRVFEAEGIEPHSGEPGVATIDVLIAKARAPRRGKPLQQRVRDYLRARRVVVPPLRNSTWQMLHDRRGADESPHFHGPIIALGRRHNIPVPFNEVVLETVTECRRDDTGPNTRRAADLLREVRRRAT